MQPIAARRTKTPRCPRRRRGPGRELWSLWPLGSAARGEARFGRRNEGVERWNGGRVERKIKERVPPFSPFHLSTLPPFHLFYLSTLSSQVPLASRAVRYTTP